LRFQNLRKHHQGKGQKNQKNGNRYLITFPKRQKVTKRDTTVNHGSTSIRDPENRSKKQKRKTHQGCLRQPLSTKKKGQSPQPWVRGGLGKRKKKGGGRKIPADNGQPSPQKIPPRGKI